MSETNGSERYWCPLCGNAHSERFHETGGYVLVRCAACDLIHVDPLPDEDALREHYQAPEYYEGSGTQGYVNYAEQRKALLPFFRRRLRVLGGHVGRPGHLLDVGCADGLFLQMARELGWSIAGVEVASEMAAKTSRRLGIPIHTNLEELSNEAYDAVSLWEVVEHLADPVSFLQRLSCHLRPGGVLLLSTPNTGHWQAQRQKENWVSYRPPAHLFYFDRDSLSRCLEQAGFENTSIAGISPLPQLPPLVDRLSARLAEAVTTGRARPWWLAVNAWRAILLAALIGHRFLHPEADVYTTLEAVAVRSS